MSQDSIDHKALQDILGSVIEAAIRNQKTSEKVLSQLSDAIVTIQTRSLGLPDVVAGQVRKQIEDATEKAANTLLKKFNSANASAERAENAYNNATKNIFKWVVLPAISITAICAIVIMGAVMYLTPSIEEIKERRQEHLALVNEITFFEKLKTVELNRCDIGKGKYVVCAKFDVRDQRTWNGYRAIVERR